MNPRCPAYLEAGAGVDVAGALGADGCAAAGLSGTPAGSTGAATGGRDPEVVVPVAGVAGVAVDAGVPLPARCSSILRSWSRTLPWPFGGSVDAGSLWPRGNAFEDRFVAASVMRHQRQAEARREEQGGQDRRRPRQHVGLAAPGHEAAAAAHAQRATFGALQQHHRDKGENDHKVDDDQDGLHELIGARGDVSRNGGKTVCAAAERAARRRERGSRQRRAVTQRILPSPALL